MEGGARSFLSRSRLRSRTRAHTGARPGVSMLPELETLSAYSALEARAVTLSADEALVVARLAELLLADTLRAYERFQAHGARADPREWKLVKRKDQLAVFKQRREAAPQPPRWVVNASASASASGSAGADMTGDLAATAQRETTLPLLLVAGALPSGTALDDAMFGLVSASTRDFKLSSAYAEDNTVVDAAVLSALEVPTGDDPFRFLGLKWVARRHAGSLKKRDVLFLESTGVTRLASGDRVGYRVMHSVNVRALAQLGAVAVADSVVRAKMSVVQLFHEREASAPVRVFARGFYDPLGGMMQFVALSVATELMLSLAHGVSDCAHLKKIARAAQRAQRDRTRRRRRSTATAMAAGGSPGVRKSSRFPPGNRYHQVDSNMHGIVEVDEAMTNGDVVLYPPTYSAHDVDMDHAGLLEPEHEPTLELSPSMCHVCECSLGGVFDRSAAPCTICFHMICSRCSVTKKLRFSWSDESARGLAQLVGSGVDTSGGGVTASSTSQSQGSTERSRSRSRSGSGGNALMAALHHSHMADVAEKPLNFCLPCVVAANLQSGTQLAIDEMASAGGAAALSALRTRTGSYMDGVTPTASATPMGRATTSSVGYGASSRLSVSSTASGASASTTPRQRWTRGASIYGARPSYDLLDYYNTGSSAPRPPTHRATTAQYFPQAPQHQYRVYSSSNSNSNGTSNGQSQRQKAFSMATTTPRDSAPKVMLFDVEDYARRASRV